MIRLLEFTNFRPQSLVQRDCLYSHQVWLGEDDPASNELIFTTYAFFTIHHKIWPPELSAFAVFSEKERDVVQSKVLFSFNFTA